MFRAPVAAVVTSLGLLAAGRASAANPTTLPTTAAARAERDVELTVSVNVRDIPAGAIARVWWPMPPTNATQRARVIRSTIVAGNVQRGTEPKAGNEILYAELAGDAAGTAAASVTFRVARRAVGELPADAFARTPADLAADALVPIGGTPAKLLASVKPNDDELKLGRALYDLIDDRMEYRKDRPGWGRGDAAWACDSRFGNCTDFHSLFISLARTEHLPARFEIGVPLPSARGEGVVAGYHCWAWFLPAGHGWVPVDISEANKHPERRAFYFGHLDADRVGFSSGRDLTLVPPQAGPPLNFFVFPHVEVGGHPAADGAVTTEIRYQDLDADE